MNNPKSGKSSLVKKMLAGAIVVLLLIQPISAIMDDNTGTEQPDYSVAESLTLGQSGEETEKSEDKQLSLGASGTIEISAPNRKIGFGQDDFDLKTGITVTGVAGEDYYKDLRVLDDGGFDPHTIGEYQVSYGVELDGQILVSATRTITVTEFVVTANNIVYQHGDNFPLKPKEIDEGQGFGYYALINDIHIEDGTGEQAYQYWLDINIDEDGGIAPLKFGTFTLDYSYKVNGETAVQFSRTISVKPQRLNFSFTPRYMTEFPDMQGVGTPDGTYWKGVYMGANRTGTFYIGDADAVDPEGTHIPQQFYEGFYVGTLFGFTPEGESTEILRHTDYLNEIVGGNSMFKSRGFLVSLDDRTKRITWNQDDYKVAITYHLAEDSRVVDAVWAITNNSTKAVDMKIHFLGDTFFAGQDSGSAHFNARTKSVYVKTALNPEDYGMLAMRASELTPFDSFYGGHPKIARDNYIFARENYPGTVADPKVNFDHIGVENPGNNLIDQSLGLQWNFRIEAGETVEKKGQVIVTEAGDVQIMPPEGKKAPNKVILPYTFTLENISVDPQNVTMNISSSQGWGVEFANGKNTITIPGGEVAYVTVYLTIPESAVTGDIDKLTLSVTSDKTVTASTITTIDTNLPAQVIHIVDQTNTNLKVAVEFINVPAAESHNTTVSILNVDGSATGIPNQTRNILSEETFDFDITGLVFDKEYIARSEVVGIDYYSEKLFTISTMANSLTLTRNGTSAPASVNLKIGDTLTETLNATVAPNDIVNKSVNWIATPTGTVTMLGSTQSGGNNSITFTKDGAVSLEARAAAAAFPSKTIEYIVDTEIPVVDSSTVTGTGRAADPFVLNVVASDPLKDGYSSGIDKLYYKVQLASAAAPTFNPATPTGWTLMTGANAEFIDSQNKVLKLYVVAVDLVGNTSGLYQHGETISSDNEAPVFSGVSDISLLVGATAPTFPDPRVIVTDNTDGNIVLNSSHVNKTTVSTAVVGVSEVTYTVADSVGNVSTMIQKVYVYGLPVISVTDNVVSIHKYDTIADFDPSNLGDDRIALSAVVSTINASDLVINDDVTSITVSGTVNYGTIGDYPITYTAKYTHAGNLEATATKTITVKVVSSLVGAPVIAADTSTLRTFKDYPTLQLTPSDIDGNVIVTGNVGGVTYEILRNNGTPATLADVHGSISSYIVRYKAVASDGATAYLDVPLYVFGKLEYTAPTTAFVLKDSGNYTAPALTVTYKGDIGAGEVTFSDALVQIPAPQATTIVGAFNLDYKAGYPASFGVVHEETVSKELIVQGRPVITTVTDTVYLHPNDLSSDFLPLTDSRVNPSAVVNSVATNGTVDNNIPVAVTETNNIIFGVEDTYYIDYKAEYTHANGNVDTETTKRVAVVVSSTVIDPNAPVISVNASTLRTYKDDPALQLTVSDINANITVTGNTSPVTYEILKRDKTTVVTGGIDAVHSAPIASYYVRYTAEGVGGAKSYLDVDLFVYGGFTYTTPPDANVLQGGNHTPPILTATYEGDEGRGLETFDAVITTPPAPDTTVVGKYEPTYTIDYPATFINPPSEEVSYQLFVQGEATINANTPVIINYYDLLTDFDPLTDGRVDLSATVATVATDGTVSPSLDITSTVTVKENTIVFGQEDTYKVVFEVTYTHANGGVITTVEKEIVVEVDKNPPTTPTTPGITIDVNGNILRTYKDYPAYQINDTMILGNATATNNQGALTYRIIDHDENATAEVAGGLTTVHSTIDSYYILYKAVGTNDTTAYVKVPLYVYGGLEYTALSNLQIEEGATPHAPAVMTATFKGDEGNGIETFRTALVSTPGTIDVSVVGKYNAPYSVKYPAAFGVTIEDTPNYDLYVQGGVKIAANSPINLILEATSLDLKQDIRIALSASVQTVALDGTVSTTTIPVTNITVASTIVFGAEGSYKVTYTSSFVHPLLGSAVAITSAGTKVIDVIVSNNDPDGPEIEVINSDGNNTDGGKFWQFIGTGADLTDGKITGGVSVTVKAPATTYTASHKILDENNNEVTLAVAIATPGEYKIRYEAKDNLDRVNVAYFDLYVVGEMEVTAVPKDIYTGVSTTPLSTAIYLPPNGTHAMKASFVNHDGTVKTAKITVDTTPININSSGIIPLTYTAEYPDDLPAPNSYGGEVDGSEVHVYELPVLNANGVVLSIHDTALDLMGDPRIGLGATVVDSSGTTLTIPKSNITVTPKNGNIQFGTIGSYEFVYSVYFDLPGGGGQIRTEKTIMINVTAAGDPKAPSIEVASGGSDPIVYFQDFADPSNVVDDNKIINNVEVTPNSGSTIVDLDYTILDNGVPISLEDAKDKIGSYVIRYEATDSEGRTGYYDVEFRVVGTITTTAGTAIDTMIGSAGAELPTTEYLGAKGIIATFTDYDGTSKSAVVTAPVQTIDTVGTREIVYSANYPTPYTTTLAKTENRLLRVHGKPQISGTTRIDLRVGAATTEMSSGVAASVQLAPLTLGGGVTTATATVGIVGVVDNTQISKKTADFNASFTLPAGYNALTLTNTAQREVVFHGKVELTGNDITLSINFPEANFETTARPTMNVAASVKYFDTATNTTVEYPAAVTVPTSATIRFGTKGTYPLTYTANDNAVTQRPAGLAGGSSSKGFSVEITDAVIGNAPSISVTHGPIDWLNTAPINLGELMTGVVATDVEDDNLTGDITVKVKKLDSGVVTDITATNVTLPAGKYEVIYTLLDKDSNKVEKVVEMFIHGHISQSASMGGNDTRQSTTPYTPNLTGMKFQYVNGVTGTTTIITPATHPLAIGTTQPNYNVSAIGDVTITVKALHPVFGEQFKTFSGTATPTSITTTEAVRVHGQILISGQEVYNARGVVRNSKSYFTVGDTIGDTALLSGVTAGYTNSSGAFVNLTSTLKVAAPGKNTSKANNFPATYSVKDDLMTAAPDVTAVVTISVDGKPKIQIDTGSIYVPVGSKENEILDGANVIVTVEDGLTPGVDVKIPFEKEIIYEKGTDLNTAGNKGKVVITAKNPNNPSSVSKGEVNFMVYAPPTIKVSGTGYLEMFKNEFTLEEVMKKVFNPSASYTDINGKSQSIEVKVDLNNFSVSQSGKYQFSVYIIDPITGAKISSPAATVFVLNRAYIQYKPQYTMTVPKEKLSNAQIIGKMEAIGIGEEVVNSQVATKTFAINTANGSLNQVKISQFAVNFNLRNVDQTRYGVGYKVPISGTFHYRNQLVEVEAVLFLQSSNTGGTSKPDVSVKPGNENKPDGDGGFLSGGNEEVDFQGDGNLSSAETAFWSNTNKLLQTVGSKNEVWTITHSNSDNPTKKGDGNSKVIAVPGSYLQMPSYVIDTLKSQKSQRLQINMGDYIWYLDATSGWKNSDRTTYPIGVKASKNTDISSILGSGVSNQQLTFGFKEGWSGATVHLGVKITDSALQGQQLYMYYYNPYTNELEFVGDMEDLGSNLHSVVVKGNYGEYVVSDQLLLNAKVANSDLINNPETGGQNYIAKYTHDLLNAGEIELPTTLQNSSIESAYTIGGSSVVKYVVAASGGLLLAVLLLFLLAKRRKENEQQTTEED